MSELSVTDVWDCLGPKAERALGWLLIAHDADIVVCVRERKEAKER